MKKHIKVIIIIGLAIYSIFSFNKIKDLSKQNTELIKKTDATFMHLLHSEDTIMPVAEKAEEISKAKSLEEMWPLLNEFSFVRGEFINHHLLIINQLVTEENIEEATPGINEYPLLTEKHMRAWHAVSGLTVDSINITYTIKHGESPDLEKSQALFRELADEFKQLHENMNRISLRKGEPVDHFSVRYAPVKKERYLEIITKHGENINAIADEYLGFEEGSSAE